MYEPLQKTYTFRGAWCRYHFTSFLLGLCTVRRTTFSEIVSLNQFAALRTPSRMLPSRGLVMALEVVSLLLLQLLLLMLLLVWFIQPCGHLMKPMRNKHTRTHNNKAIKRGQTFSITNSWQSTCTVRTLHSATTNKQVSKQNTTSQSETCGGVERGKKRTKHRGWKNYQ